MSQSIISTMPETDEEWKIYHELAEILLPLKDGKISFRLAQQLIFLYINRGNRLLLPSVITESEEYKMNLKK